MNYEEVLLYIEEKNKLGSVPGLENISELLSKLGNPELYAPVFHIAGTNGKGSIMAYIENILIKSGLVVGRYISPTIFDYRERFQINKKYISKEECSKIITEVSEAVGRMISDGKTSPTSFEIETAAAFLYFKEKHVDVMLIECGMGGRLDATNVFGGGSIDILASISMDHMNFLGDSIEKITAEKIGIVKEKDVLVTSMLCNAAEKVVNEFCINDKVKRYKADSSALKINSMELEKTYFTYKNEDYSINISGDFQVDNAITAIEAIRAYNDICDEWSLHSIDSDIIKQGISDTKWPGRFSIIGKAPLFIVDGAHNEDAWRRLRNNINFYFTKQKLVYIIGVLKDKEYSKMLDYLVPTMKCAYTVTPDSVRAFDGRLLMNMINEKKVPAEYKEHLSDAVKSAEKSAGKDGLVIACGSLSFIGDIIKIKEDRA